MTTGRGSSPGGLSPERFWQVDRLFAEALEQDAVGRESFVHQRAGPDQSLLREVLALLAATTDAEQRLGESAVDFAAPVMAAREADGGHDRDLPTGARVGPYRIVRELGRGGMGIVYLAERADAEFEKEVALKVVKRGMDTDEILGRFRQERQILARLEHDGIARLYDGGVTVDGRPYLVMEYVAGESLTDYCDGRHLALDQRLRLFQQVCQVVQVAHQRLVVHRDLKPSNILVTATGQVKLLDFGLARLLESDDAAGSRTSADIRILTPEYAAPEQILGGIISTATDVYALGAVLYQMLTGRRPLESTGADRALALQSLLQQVPAPSSRSASSMSPETAVARATTALQQARQLQGDLDAVIARALEKEPARRYQSPGALAEDLERYLSHQPVAARPATLGYRARRFAHRHRLRLTLVTTAVVVATVGITYAGLRITRERDNATVEAAKAEATTAFLTQLFYDSDTEATLGDTLTIGMLLDRGTSRLDSLASQPAVQAAVQEVIGGLYHKFGDTRRAGPLLEQSLATRRILGESPQGDLARSAMSLAELRWQQGRYPVAQSLYDEAIRLTRVRVGPNAPALANLLSHRGFMLVYQGRFTKARPLIDSAVKIFRQAPDDWHAQMATALYGLATIDMHSGQLEAAERGFREALALVGGDRGEITTRGSDIIVELGVLLTRQRRTTAAESLLTIGLAQRRLLLGPEHRFLATTLANLAYVRRLQNDLLGADSLYQQALAMQRRNGMSAHTDFGRLQIAYGSNWLQRGNLDSAEGQMRAGLRLIAQLEGPRTAASASGLVPLAEVLRQRGALRESEQRLREALAIQQAAYGDSTLPTASVAWSLGMVLREQQRFIEAESLLNVSLEVRQRLQGEAGLDTPASLAALGRLWCERGRDARADSALTQAEALQARLRDETGIGPRAVAEARAGCQTARRQREASPARPS